MGMDVGVCEPSPLALSLCTPHQSTESHHWHLQAEHAPGKMQTCILLTVVDHLSIPCILGINLTVAVLAWAQVEKGAGWIFNIASAEALGPFPSAPVRRNAMCTCPLACLGRASIISALPPAMNAWSIACQ